MTRIREEEEEVHKWCTRQWENTIDFGVRRSKVKVTRRPSLIWTPGGGIVTSAKYRFLPRDAMYSAEYAVARCLFVCHTPVFTIVETVQHII